MSQLTMSDWFIVLKGSSPNQDIGSLWSIVTRFPVNQNRSYPQKSRPFSSPKPSLYIFKGVLQVFQIYILDGENPKLPV